jgi:hypothetical protein
LRDQATAPYTVARDGVFGSPPSYTLHRPTNVASHAFASHTEAARRYELEIDGRRIPILMPAVEDATQGAFHTPQQIARAVAAMPRSARDLITRIDMNPRANPADAHWATHYGIPGFRSFATAGADGVVDLFPMHARSTVATDRLASSLTHETGHTLSRAAWGDPDVDARWGAWRTAMASDGLRASGYARSSLNEDFAEAFVLYQRVRGTTEEAEVRALMPERFRLIDELLAARP